LKQNADYIRWSHLTSNPNIFVLDEIDLNEQFIKLAIFQKVKISSIH